MQQQQVRKRIMRPIPGYVRIAVSSRMTLAIEKRIRETCKRFHVSRSFVIAVACADYFGISHERYDR